MTHTFDSEVSLPSWLFRPMVRRRLGDLRLGDRRLSDLRRWCRGGVWRGGELDEMFARLPLN